MVAPAKIAITVKTMCMFCTKMAYPACGDGDELGVSFNRPTISFLNSFQMAPVLSVSSQ